MSGTVSSPKKEKTGEKNFYAFQLDFGKIVKDSKGNETYKEFWDYAQFKKMFESILDKDINDRKKLNNTWFMSLDQGNEFSEKIDKEGKKLEHTYIVGRFLYAEYGYVGKLRHVDTMQQREHDKHPREGEEKYVYFYIRANDGLLLLQGDMKVIRSKVEEYIFNNGKEYLDSQQINNFSVSTLLRGDFLDEVKKLDEVTKIEIELAVEKTDTYENELMAVAQNHAKQVNANYATIVMQSKYKKEGMSMVDKMLSRVKPNGSTRPINGVNNIKVIGKKEGELTRVYLSKISEKHVTKVKVDDNRVIDIDDIHKQMKEVGKKREGLWRGDK
ncbi:hypothetical protein [Bacillus thuringiensis]|uniref:hypothetical protein n=1 Tax=Bacillus thuringiensis TaxID=1428 RepID=UPI0011A939EF|nr:hypothetical protein [Bacillus thuringiensis]